MKSRQVLDFGCGNGAQTIEFKDQRASIIALDIDTGDLATLSAYLSEHEIKNIEVMHYDGTTIPLADESVDLVISYEVLEHVTSENVSLQEIYRILKPGGEFIVSVPNKWWIFETHGAHLPLLPWNRVPFFSWLPRGIHQRYAKARIYTEADIRSLLLENNFDVRETAYITAPMDVVKNPKIQSFLRKYVFRGDLTRLPFLSTAILVHGVKSSNF